MIHCYNNNNNVMVGQLARKQNFIELVSRNCLMYENRVQLQRYIIRSCGHMCRANSTRKKCCICMDDSYCDICQWRWLIENSE